MITTHTLGCFLSLSMNLIYTPPLFFKLALLTSLFYTYHSPLLFYCEIIALAVRSTGNERRERAVEVGNNYPQVHISQLIGDHR